MSAEVLAERERKRKEKMKKKKKARQQKKKGARRATPLVRTCTRVTTARRKLRGRRSSTSRAEAAEASRRASAASARYAPAPSQQAQQPAQQQASSMPATSACGAAFSAHVSAMASAASSAFGEGDDEGDSDDGGGLDDPDGELDDEMDARSWLEAAKGGQLSQMVQGYERNPSLLHEGSSGIGHTALHWCAAKGHTDAVRWLLSVGASAAQRNESGSTSLHAAASNGQTECAKVLFQEELAVLGACPLLAVRDSDGRTAAAIARERGYAELATLLEAHTPKDALEAPPRSPVSTNTQQTRSTPSSTSSAASRDGGGRRCNGRCGGRDACAADGGHGRRGGGGNLGDLGGLGAMAELLGAMGGGGGSGRGRVPSRPVDDGAGGGSRSAGDPLSVLDRSELTCLIDVLSALGDRRDPPLTPLQAAPSPNWAPSSLPRG